MIGYIDAFKKMALLNGRSSCGESIQWMLSMYDSDAIDLKEVYDLAMDSESVDIPLEWRRDAKRYIQSYAALILACKHNNVSPVNSRKYRLIMDGKVQNFTAKNELTLAYESIINDFARDYVKELTYTIRKDGVIEKVEEPDFTYVHMTSEIVITDRRGNVYVAENKYQVEEKLKEIYEYAKSLCQSKIKTERHMTDPSKLFDVWVKI